MPHIELTVDMLDAGADVTVTDARVRVTASGNVRQTASGNIRTTGTAARSVTSLGLGADNTPVGLSPDLLQIGPEVTVEDDDVRITTNNEVRITPEAYIRTVGTQSARSVTSVMVTPKE